MAQHLDQKMLTGFVREAQGYLPQLRESIAVFRQEPSQREALEEAFRYAHTIKGASAMVGLPTLSHIAAYVESTLEDVLNDQRQLDATCDTWVCRTTEHIHQYLEGLLTGDMQQQKLVMTVVQEFRRFQQLPTSGDAAALAAVMDEQTELIHIPAARDEEVSTTADETPVLHDAVGVAATDDAAHDDDFPVEMLSEAAAAAAAGLDMPEETALSQDAVAASASSATPPSQDALQELLSQIDADVHHVYGQHTMSTVPSGAIPLAHQADRYILFTLGGSQYAVPVPHVLEIGRVPRITPVPNVPVWVRGVINLRGDILSVIDFRSFLGMEEPHSTEHSRMLVVKTPDDEMTTSLIVDQIMGIVPLASSHLALPATATSNRVAPYLAGAYEHDNQVCAVFDLERLLSSPEVRQFE